MRNRDFRFHITRCTVSDEGTNDEKSVPLVSIIVIVAPHEEDVKIDEGGSCDAEKAYKHTVAPQEVATIVKITPT